MNPFVKNIVAGIITAAIIANVSLLFSFNARLARIETMLSPTPHVQFSQDK